MISPHYDFLARRQRRWELLGRLVERLERDGPRSLQPDEVEMLGRLYRATAADLARARAIGLSGESVDQLNGLVARVHTHLYRGRPRRLRTALEFMLVGFPRLFRQTAPYTFAAYLLFALPFLCTWQAVRDDPTLTYSLLTPEMRANADAFEESPTGERSGGLGLMASSFYFTNNTSVAFRAFAGGVTAGLLTGHVLVMNGVQLGATAALVEHLQSHGNFWAFVAPHGALELLAIFIAGGAGLLIGRSMIQPGDRTRREALVEAGNTAVRMAMGAALLLFWAGLTEGFISPSGLENETKLTLGVVNASLLVLYLGMGDRVGTRVLGRGQVDGPESPALTQA